MDRWQQLSDFEDYLYECIEPTPERDKCIAQMLWERVQIEIAAGEDYGEDDIAEYRRAAVAA